MPAFQSLESIYSIFNFLTNQFGLCVDKYKDPHCNVSCGALHASMHAYIGIVHNVSRPLQNVLQSSCHFFCFLFPAPIIITLQPTRLPPFVQGVAKYTNQRKEKTILLWL